MLLILLRIWLLVYMGYDLYRIILDFRSDESNPNFDRWCQSLFISLLLFILSYVKLMIAFRIVVGIIGVCNAIMIILSLNTDQYDPKIKLCYAIAFISIISIILSFLIR